MQVQFQKQRIQIEIVSTQQKVIINPNDFEFVPGQRIKTELIYLKNEKCLYTPVNADKYGKRFKCFTSSCSARATIRTNGICEKSKKKFRTRNIQPIMKQKQNILRRLKSK